MKKILTVAVLTAASAWALVACDLCAIYDANQAQGEVGKGFLAGVAEQFTHFGTLQEDGDEVSNPADQYLESSITQLLLGYNVNERFGVQFNAPIIYRSFRRPEGDAIQEGTVSCLGDVSLTSRFQVIRQERRNTTFVWNVLGGVKFPTGSTSRLKEELNETAPAPGEPESGIHGHDLTLGSGSVDGIIGTSVYARWQRAFFNAALQYAIRSEGDYDYQFANDLLWSGGPGVLLVLNEQFTLSLQLNCSGETKDKDELEGEQVDDTGITTVYLGPDLAFTWGSKLSAELGADFPVSIHDTALQIVPDWRLRAAVTWHF